VTLFSPPRFCPHSANNKNLKMWIFTIQLSLNPNLMRIKDREDRHKWLCICPYGSTGSQRRPEQILLKFTEVVQCSSGTDWSSAVGCLSSHQNPWGAFRYSSARTWDACFPRFREIWFFVCNRQSWQFEKIARKSRRSSCLTEDFNFNFNTITGNVCFIDRRLLQFLDPNG
jgi:hypothetical protein